MARKLFCELCPLTYKISVFKGIIARKIKDLPKIKSFAKTKSDSELPSVIYKHSSLIRRTLGNVNLELQENKATNLALSAPRVNKIVINPGETFSFWYLVGNTTKKRGYKEGLTIEKNSTSSGIGGGMCQFTNLIHWMVLHSPLTIVEHHHHDGFDLFPDFNRQVPFGTGTSIMYNYLDYRFKNETDTPFQIIVYVTDTHLVGELRAGHEFDFKYHIVSENEHFVEEEETVYRVGQVYRNKISKATGDVIDSVLIRENHAKVMYDTSHLEISKI